MASGSESSGRRPEGVACKQWLAGQRSTEWAQAHLGLSACTATAASTGSRQVLKRTSSHCRERGAGSDEEEQAYKLLGQAR